MLHQTWPKPEELYAQLGRALNLAKLLILAAECTLIIFYTTSPKT